MKQRFKIRSKFGFSFVEAIIGIALFALISVALIGSLIAGYFDVFLAGNRQRAINIAEEGLEAVRNIRDAGYANLVDGNYGLAVSANQYVFSGTSDNVDNNTFTRQINISSPSANRKLVTSTVTWTQQTGRNGSVVLSSYFNNWQASAAGSKKGMLVYGEGGLASDTIRYKLLKSDGTWDTAGTAADIDVLSTDKGLRVAQLYASSTRNEKILISKHYVTGTTTQYLYAQVFNGTTWGNVVALTNYNSSTNINVENFSGTYLSNGDFMIVYSDNTTNVPQFVTWDGISWSVAQNTQNIGGVARAIVIKARPATNEVMAVFFDSANDTNSLYFDGAAYASGNWTILTEHGTAAPSTNKALIEFVWSANSTTTGAIIYTNANADRSLETKIFTANGAGGGVWSSNASTSNQPGGRKVGTMKITGSLAAQNFIACDKDQNAAPNIYCYSSNFTPAWSNPTNQLIGATDAGIQRSFDLVYEHSGETALIVYSDTTTTPKLKKYDRTTNTFDAAATSMTATTAAVETVRLVPADDSDNIMVLMADTGQNMYSVVWDGSINNFFTTPTGWARTTHGTSGSGDEDFWYDFAWDLY